MHFRGTFQQLLDYNYWRNVYDVRQREAEAALCELYSVEDFAVDVSAVFIQLLGDSGSTVSIL